MSQFDALAVDHRSRLGVTWSLADDAIMGLRNKGAKGNGAVAMREICDLADQVGMTLTLGTSVEKLKPWYEAFGFKRTREFKMGNYAPTFFTRRPCKG